MQPQALSTADQDVLDYLDTPAFPNYPSLSEEIAFHIFTFLDPSDLCRLCCVNFAWKRLMLDPRLWSKLHERSNHELTGLIREYDSMYDPTEALERDIDRIRRKMAAMSAKEKSLRNSLRSTGMRVPIRVRQRFFFPDYPEVRTTLVMKILSYLEASDLITCQFVCRTWCRMARDQSLWQQLHLKETRLLDHLKIEYDRLYDPPVELDNAIRASVHRVNAFSKRLNLGLKQRMSESSFAPSNAFALAGSIFPRSPEFPSDLFLYILSFLPARDIAHCMLVCTTWMVLIDTSDPLWASVLENESMALQRLTMEYERLYSPPESLEMAIRNKQFVINAIKTFKNISGKPHAGVARRKDFFVVRVGIATLPRMDNSRTGLSGHPSSGHRKSIRMRSTSLPGDSETLRKSLENLHASQVLAHPSLPLSTPSSSVSFTKSSASSSSTTHLAGTTTAAKSTDRGRSLAAMRTLGRGFLTAVVDSLSETTKRATRVFER